MYCIVKLALDTKQHYFTLNYTCNKYSNGLQTLFICENKMSVFNYRFKLDTWGGCDVSEPWDEFQVGGSHTGCLTVAQLLEEVMVVLEFPCRNSKYSLAQSSPHAGPEMELHRNDHWKCTIIHSKPGKRSSLP